MVNFCAVFGCSNRSNRNKEKSLYQIPTIVTKEALQSEDLSARRRREWLAALRRKDVVSGSNLSHIRVCSDHFLSGRPSALYATMDPDWVPSLKLGKEGD